MKRNDERQLDRAELAVAGFALAALLAAVALIFCAGCTGPSVFDPSGERPDYIESHVAALTNRLATASATLESPVAQAESLGGEGPIDGTDAVSFAGLRWCYGGFNGANAERVSGCVIADLKISGSGMSYKWQAGGCEMLGAADRGDASCIAALFVMGADGKWKGGKFDWISTSRTSRSFENIHGGYNGWPTDSIETAREFAFVIVSRDGRRRSNVIVSAK